MSSRTAHATAASLTDARLQVHAGGTRDWSISREAAAYLGTLGGPQSVSLETGAGLSTLLFAKAGGQHICITPSAEEIARIQQECQALGISTERVQFVQAPSEQALPGMELPPLDVVLIDGAHGFPLPQIDFYYTAPALKLGGLMIIDDVHIWACGILVKVLAEDPAWEFVATVGRRTTIFRKVAEFRYQEFCDQPYVMRKTRWPKFVTSLLRCFDLIATGQFGLLWQRIRKAMAGQ